MKKYKTPNGFKKFIRRCWRNLPEFFTFKVPFEEPSKEKIVFIVGSGRSGTTILKNELSSRYHIKFPVEMPALGSMIKAYFFWRVINYNAKFEVINSFFMSLLVRSYDVNIETRDIEGKVKNYNISREYGFERFTLEDSAVKDSIGFSYLYIALLKRILDISDSSDAIGDKTPWNTFHMRKIAKNFPNALFVHIVRDGREVAVSYNKSLGKLMNLNVTDGAKRWRDSLSKVDDMRGVLGNRLIELKYEDLISDPDKTLDRLSQSLGLKARESRILIEDMDSDIQQHSNLRKSISEVARANKAESLKIPSSDLKVMKKYLLAYGYMDE